MPVPTNLVEAPCAACPNCGSQFTLPRPNYCPDCGQESHLKPPTLLEFAKQFGGNYVSVEGALWRTLALLMLRPGWLTKAYLAGRRRRYVLPLRLFLTISVLVLLLVRVLASTTFDESDKPVVVFDKPSNFTVLGLGFAKVGKQEGKFFCEGLPVAICKRLQQRLDGGPAALQHEAARWGERFLSNLGGTMFVLLPSFALWLKLAYLNRGMRFTEHLVFALHVHTFWFVMLAVALTGWPWLITLAALAVPVYTWMAMGHVYADKRWRRLARVALVSCLYGLSLALAAAGAGVWSALF